MEDRAQHQCHAEVDGTKRLDWWQNVCLIGDESNWMSGCLNVFIVVHISDSMKTGVIEIIFHTGVYFITAG